VTFLNIYGDIFLCKCKSVDDWQSGDDRRFL